MTSTLSDPKVSVRPSNDVVFKVDIENKMMRDVRPVAAVQQPVRLCVVQLKGAGQDIYAADAVGGEILRRYYSDPSTDSGWARQDISLPGHGFISMTAGHQADGTPRLFVMTANADLAPSQAGPATIFEIPLDADGTPGMPNAIADTSVFGTASPDMAFSPLGPSLWWGEVDTDGVTSMLRLAYGPSLDTTLYAHDGTAMPWPAAGTCPVIVPDGTGAAVWPNVLVAYETNDGGAIGTFYGQSVDGGLSGSIGGFAQWPPDANFTLLTGGSFGDGRRSLFTVSQDGTKIYMLEGHPEPSRPGDVVWDASSTTLPVGQLTSGVIGDIAVVETKEGGLGLYCEAVFPNFPMCRALLTDCGPKVGDQWGQLDLVLDFVAEAHAVFRDDEGDFGYAVSDPQGFIHLAIRDDNEDWNVEQVEVDTPDGNQFVQANVYRVGVIVSDESGRPASGRSVTIAADDEAFAFVGGKSRYLSSDEPFTTQTDASGSVWLMMDIGDSLAVPTLSLTSTDGIFDGNTIVVKPEGDAQHYTTHTTPDELQTAVDDTGNPLLPAGSPYTDISAGLNRLGDSIAHIYEPHDFVSDRLKVSARRGVRVVTHLGEMLPETPLSAGHWAMTVKDGKVEFEELTPETATMRRLELRSRVAVAQGLTEDAMPNAIWDDIEDAFDSIGDAIVDAATVVIDGVTAALSYVVDGIAHLVEVALQSVSVVLDCVKAVLDFAGAVFGKVLGWLIRAIGWLLGLPDLQKIKNDIKARIVASVSSLHTALPDPMTYVAPAKQQIENCEKDLDALINSFKQTPEGTESNSQFFSAVQSVASVLSSFGSSSIATEATWLIEKFTSALPDLVDIPDVPDMGIVAPLTDMSTQFSTAAADLSTFGSDIVAAGLVSWMSSFASFDEANLDPVLDTVNTHGQVLLGCMDNCVSDAGAALHAMWANPTALTDWLDQPIYIPFFSAFYNGFVGDDLSILDIAALMAAMPYSIIGPNEAEEDDDDDDRQALLYTILSLMIVRTGFSGWAALVQQPAGGASPNSLKVTRYVLAGLNVFIGALTLGFAASDSDNKQHWYAAATVDLWAGIMGCFLLFAKSQSDDSVLEQYGQWAESGLNFLAAIVGFVLNGVYKNNREAFGYLVLKTVSVLANLGADQKWFDVTDLRPVYVGAQTAFSGFQALLFRHDNV